MSDHKTRHIELEARTTKAADGATLTHVVASTASVDRMGDIVEQDWQLERFQRNPVILWGHDASIPPIGRAESVEVRDGALHMSIRWDEGEHNPLGRQVAAQFREGFLGAVSVGFRPGQVTPRSSLAEDDERYGQRGAVLSRNELLETSAVTIPANAEALVVGRSHLLDALEERAAAIVERKLDERLAALEAAEKGDDADALTAKVVQIVRTSPEVRRAVEGVILSAPADEPPAWWLGEQRSEPQGWWLRAPAERSPACRMADETQDECISRKVPELIAEGMEQDQAVAAAASMCETACTDKSAAHWFLAE